MADIIGKTFILTGLMLLAMAMVAQAYRVLDHGKC
jgi:hypothetical protein